MSEEDVVKEFHEVCMRTDSEEEENQELLKYFYTMVLLYMPKMVRVVPLCTKLVWPWSEI